MSDKTRDQLADIMYDRWVNELSPAGDVKVRLPESAKRYLEDVAKRRMEPLSVTVRRILLEWIIDDMVPWSEEIDRLNAEWAAKHPELTRPRRIPSGQLGEYLESLRDAGFEIDPPLEGEGEEDIDHDD